MQQNQRTLSVIRKLVDIVSYGGGQPFTFLHILIHLAIWTNTLYNVDEYILQVRQIYFAIVSYGGQGGRGRCWRAALPLLFIPAQDSLTQKATHRHCNNPSTHLHVWLNINCLSRHQSHILLRRDKL